MRPKTLLASLSCAGLLAACGGDSNNGQIDVNLEYPTEGARTITGSVHVWVLQSSAIDDSEEPPPGCAALVGDIADPYDVGFQRFFDDVFLQPDEPSPVAEGLPGGALLVYVEAVDYTGATHLAGCALSETGSGSVTVQLVTPATFDCGDAATEEDARCDDGDLCTVGETCRGSSCQGGVARDCTFAADGCNAADCDSQVGCVTTALTGPACDDSLFCSTGEVCMEGACLGAETDCTSLENGCRSGVCSEDLNSCQPANFPNGTPCDLEVLFCRVQSGPVPLCNGFGTCVGGIARNCADQCNAGVCDEINDECDLTPLSPRACNDNDACTVNEQCNGLGTCTGGVLKDTDGDNYSPIGCPPDTNGAGDCNDNDPAVNPGQVEGPNGNATCTNGKDDDCDGLTDAADNQGVTNCLP